jgi:hypothetical protein
MTGYLARLKAKIAQTSLPQQPSKPSKAPFEAFEGDAGRHVSRIDAGSTYVVDEAEREAIAIELGGVPEIYAGAFAAIQAHPPADVPHDRWERFIDDAGRFLDRWGAEAERQGWTADDLFGLDPIAPMARYDRMGLIWMLHGESVVALDVKQAKLVGGLAFRRRS